MPTYAFECPKCEKNFDVLCSWDESQCLKCEVCGTGCNMLLTIPYIKFSEPKSTSKWDNFSYRAGYNLEKAQDERRVAESLTKDANPYAEMDDTNTPGVFDRGGADMDLESLPGVKKNWD